MSIWQGIFSIQTDDSQTKNRSVLNLHIGDTVSHDLIDYLVVGQDTFRSDSGHTWTDYHLEGDGYTWLVFEKDLDVAAIYKPADLNLAGNPPQEIKYEGTVYGLCEFGSAGIKEVNGQSVNNLVSSIRYWQYEDNTGSYVIYVEERDGTREISCGYCIRPRELRLIRRLRAIYV